MVKNSDLTSKQNEILMFIKKFIAKNKQSPSVREIASNVGLSSPATVHVHIQNLISKGYLERDDVHKHLLRLLVPNEFELRDKEAVAVPFIGSDFFDDVIKFLDDPYEFFYLSSSMVSVGSGIFVVEVRDTRYSKLGFLQNDFVIFERVTNYSIGDIIFLSGSEYDFSFLLLDSKNINHLNDYIKEGKVIGKAIGFFRKF